MSFLRGGAGNNAGMERKGSTMSLDLEARKAALLDKLDNDNLTEVEIERIEKKLKILNAQES